jgi:hypothetical protein
MNKVYLNAKSLYCWLGQDENMAQCLYTCIQAHRQKVMYSDHKDMDDRIFASIQTIAESEYFTRMWIVQEFLLGREKNFLAGTQKIPYEHLEELLGLRTAEDDAEKMWDIDGPSKSNKSILTDTRDFLHRHLAETKTVRAASENKLKQELQYRMGWSRIRASKSSGWLQLHDYSKRKTSWGLEKLFEGFGAMSCSVPQDKIFALLGLLEVRTGQELVMALVDYDLSVWQLLHRIIFPITYPTYPRRKTNFEGVQAFTFTYTYAQHVIMDTEDEHMTTSTCFEFSGGPVALDNHLNCYCLDSWSSTNLSRVCLQKYSSFPTPRQGHFAFPMEQHVTRFQYLWYACSTQPYNLVFLPSMDHRSQESFGTTGALIELCNDGCYRRDQWDGSRKLDCKGHSISGFSIIPQECATFERVPWFGDSKVDIADGSLSSQSLQHPPLLHDSMLSETLPTALSDFEKSVRVFAIEHLQFRLVISLEMLVRLTRVLRKLEEAFEREIQPYRRIIRYTYYYDEKEVVC